MRTHSIAVIGGGPAGLMAAEILATSGCVVTVYDRMPSVGRKFLMAGRGGLNLTHSEPLDSLLTRYGSAQNQVEPSIRAYSPEKLIAWCEALGQPTFIGTSGRVFPKAFKASPLLRAWLGRLHTLGVTFAMQHTWKGWDQDGALQFLKPDGGNVLLKSDATLLALGGASWPRLGSDGTWTSFLPNTVSVLPLRPANSGLLISWSDILKAKFVGQPLKSITLTYGGKTVSGEFMLTATGLEGTPAYALSGLIRDDIAQGKTAVIRIDLRPNVSHEDIAAKLRAPRKRQSLSTFLGKTLGFSPVTIALIQEVIHHQKVNDTPNEMATLIKSLPLTVTGTAGLERAISSAGGVDFKSVNHHLMLSALPGVFVAGEMLNWEAPTGGYLLQASFSTAATAAQGIIEWLSQQKGT
jgi:uncharacterized flavoprotein (TIGR03862 family)